MTRPIRLLRAFATVGAWTMASRVLGFARDIMVAAFLGAGPVAEAFFVAFRLPNMFRRFFAEGAFNMAFVPMFAKRLEGDGPEAARRFAEEAFASLATALIALTLVAQLAMPWFVLALASGYESDGGKLDLAVALSRVTFPYILFISLAALFSGVLNSLGRFAAAAAAPVLLNVILIAAMAVGRFMGWPMGEVLAWSVPVAGLAQLALVARAAAGLGMVLRLGRPRLTPDMRRLVRIGIPAALAGGVMQINLVVGTQVASWFDGAVAWLWYADRIYQLPLGVVGVAIGVVLLPELARRLRKGDAEGGRHSMNRAAEFALLFTLPAAAALIAVPATITSVLYERGQFGAADTAATALALAIYAAGLPAFVLQKVVQPAYFAREDTRTPLRYAVVAMVVNVTVAVAGAPLIGFLAAAVGTTLAGWVNIALLWRGARDFPEAGIDARLATRFPRTALASLLMAACLLMAVAVAGDLFVLPRIRYLSLAALVLGGGAVFAAVAFGSGAVRMADLRNSLSRRGGG